MKTEKKEPSRRRLAVKSKLAPAPGGHYSQAIRSGNHVYISGSGPFDPTTHKVVGQTIDSQTEQTLKNIQAILEAAGASLKDVVQVTVYLRDMNDFEAMDKTYKRFFPKDPPARTTVEVGLYGSERLLAVDAVAIKGTN